MGAFLFGTLIWRTNLHVAAVSSRHLKLRFDMFREKHNTKYTLDYIADTDIPRGVFAYVRMVIKRNPRMWTFFILMDWIHALRYPIAFILVGNVIDAIAVLETSDPIPQHVWLLTFGVFLTLFIGEICHAIPHYIFFDWWKRIRGELRSDMFAYALGHSFTYFQNHFAGSLARKVSEGIEKGIMIGEQVRFQLQLPLVSMIFTSFMLFKISPLIGAIICIFVVIILLPIFLKLEKLREKSRIYADHCSNVSGQIVDSLTNIASVKSYAHEAREMIEHCKVTEQQMQGWHKMLRTFLMLDNYRRATLVLFGSGMLFACLYGWKSGMITIGEMSTIMGLTFSFTGMAWYLSFGIIHLSESYGYLNDSLTTLIVPHSVRDKEDACELAVSDARILFKDMSFDYGDSAKDRPVFENLNIQIEAGQRIGLIGPSGAGKSSFVNLIQRFFDVKSGAILIDGQDIRDVSQKSLRHTIATIPQDTALFHRTIMENIRYGHLEASDDEVIEAARRAHAFDFITALPDGFDTLVGERGVKLSGGQRQRIAIARAILKDAPILILDEATSALDSESEQLLQASLEELMQGKTVIAVAHRLSTIAHLDRLLVMDGGKIIEDGKHDELIAKRGVYAKLWGMQSQGFLPK